MIRLGPLAVNPRHDLLRQRDCIGDGGLGGGSPSTAPARKLSRGQDRRGNQKHPFAPFVHGRGVYHLRLLFAIPKEGARLKGQQMAVERTAPALVAPSGRDGSTVRFISVPDRLKGKQVVVQSAALIAEH